MSSRPFPLPPPEGYVRVGSVRGGAPAGAPAGAVAPVGAGSSQPPEGFIPVGVARRPPPPGSVPVSPAVATGGLPQQTPATTGFQAPPQTAVSPVKPVAVATSAVPAAGAPSFGDIVLDSIGAGLGPLGRSVVPFGKAAVRSIPTTVENAIETVRTLQKAKENADVALRSPIWGEPPPDVNIHAASEVIDKFGKKKWIDNKAYQDFMAEREPSIQEGIATPSKLPSAIGGAVGSQVGPFAATVAGAVTLGPVGGVLASVSNDIGSRAREMREKDVDEPVSAIGVGSVIGALNSLGPILAMKGITKGFFSSAGVGATTEVVQEILAILHEKFYGIPQDHWVWRLIETFLVGFLLEGTAHVALHPGEAPTPPPPPGAPPPGPPAAPAPVVPRMAGTNAPAFQATAPPPIGPFASRIPTPTAPRAGPPLTAVPKLEGTNAPQFQGAPPTPTGPFASRVPTPTQPPIQGPAPRPPYEPVPAEGVVQKDIRTPVPFPARESAEAFGLMGPRQTPPAGPMSPAEQSAQVLMRANQGARRATVTPQESRLGDPAAELLGEAREEVSRLLSIRGNPVHPNDPQVHELLWEWLGSEDPRAVVIREQLIEVWPRRSAPGPDPIPSRTDLLVWAKEVEKSQQQPAPPPPPPVVSEPAVVSQAPQPLIPPAPQRTLPPSAPPSGPQLLSPPPQPGARPTATAAAIAPPPAVAPFTQQVTYPPQRPAPPTPTDADKLAAKVLTGIGETPPAPAVSLPSADEVAAAKARNAAQKAKNAALRAATPPTPTAPPVQRPAAPAVDLAKQQAAAEAQRKAAIAAAEADRKAQVARDEEIAKRQAEKEAQRQAAIAKAEAGRAIAEAKAATEAADRKAKVQAAKEAKIAQLQAEKEAKEAEAAAAKAKLEAAKEAKRAEVEERKRQAEAEAAAKARQQAPPPPPSGKWYVPTTAHVNALKAAQEAVVRFSEAREAFNAAPPERKAEARQAMLRADEELQALKRAEIEARDAYEADVAALAEKQREEQARIVVTPDQLQTASQALYEQDYADLDPTQQGTVRRQAKTPGWLEKIAAAGKEAQARRRAQEQSGKLLSPNPIELAQWIRDMVTEIIGDVASGAIKIGNAVQVIVDKFGEEARPHAMKVFLQAKAIAEGKQAPPPGMPSAAPPVSSGAPAAASASVTATQPAGSPTGQQALVDVPLADMPEATNRAWPIRVAIRAAIKTWVEVQRRSLQLYQMAQQNPGFKPIQDETAAQHRRDAAIHQWQNKGGRVYKAIVALGKAKTKKFFTFSLHVRLLELSNDRALTEEEVAKIGANHGLDEKTFATYQQLQQYFRESLDGLRQAQIEKLQATMTDPDELAKAVKKTNEQFAEQAGRHYFPLKRFGNYMVSATIPVTDPRIKSGWKVDQMAQFETETAAQQAAEEMNRVYRADGQVAKVRVSERLSPELRNLSSLPPDMAARLAEELSLTAEQRADLAKMVGDRITDNSFLNHLKKAKGTAGFSTDGLRSLLSYIQSHANHMGNTLEGHNLERAVKDAEAQIATMGYGTEGVTNIIRMQQVLKVMQEAKNNMLNPKVRSNAFAGAMSAWHFGFNPKQIIINLGQSIQTVPILSQQEISETVETPSGRKIITKEVGRYEATKQVLVAQKDVNGIYRQRVYEKIGGETKYTGKIKPHELAAMQRATDEGVIPDTQAANVASQSKGNLLERMFGWAIGIEGERMGRSVGDIASWLPEQALKGHQISEVFNRQVAFLSSFRALEKAGHPDPYMGAINVVKLSQGYNAASNRSWLQQMFPNNMLFKSYTQNNVYLQLMSKYAFRMWFAQFVMSGLQGGLGLDHLWKFINSLGSYLKKRAGYKDPHVDIMHDIREFSTAMMGRLPTELLLHGVSGGNPWVDLSGSTGQGRFLPFIDPVMDLAHGTIDYKTFAEREFRDLGGVALGTGLDAVKALAEDSPESITFWKALLPKMLGQLTEAQSAYEEGGVKDAAGNMLMRLDTTNPGDLAKIVGIAAGLPPKDVTLAKAGKWAAKEHQIYYGNLIDNMQQAYNRAQESGDEDDQAEVNRQIDKMNDEILPEGIRRTIGQYHRNYMTRERNQQRNEEGNFGPRQWWDVNQQRMGPYQPTPAPQP